MTLALPNVYAPQHDTHLLIATMHRICPPRDLVVADLCTGSGVVAVSAVAGGARRVDAFDLSPDAVTTARMNARAAGVGVEVFQQSWFCAVGRGPYDLVVCNPPYVPECPEPEVFEPVPTVPTLAVNGGADGRLVLDPLCVAAPALLDRGGTLLVVQSEFADIALTVRMLNENGLRAWVVTRTSIPFGPILHNRAHWLESTGRLRPGRRYETVAAIAAVKR